MNMLLARAPALLERLSPTSQIIVGAALLISLGFVVYLLTRRGKA